MSDGDEEICIKLSEFSTDQMFTSREELLEWTQNTVRFLGFVIVTRRTKKYVNGFVYKIILRCDRGGEYTAKNISRASGSKKINCQFQLQGKYSKERDQWMIKVICDEHNHLPAQYMEGHPFLRRLSVDERCLVADLTRKNVAARGLLATLKEQNENNELERHSCSFDLNNVPAFDINYEPPSYNSFIMKRIPDVFHRYIAGIQDVMDDGNCEFRVVAVCLGHNEEQWLNIRQQLLEELCSQYYAYYTIFTDGFNELYKSLCWSESPAPAEHWMDMPLTGYLIANRFGVIVHCLCEQAMTCFPLWRGPEEFQDHRAITLAHVNDNHYVSVTLQGNYPMPPTTMYWNAHRSLSASAWKTLYSSRFELFNQFMPHSSVAPLINVKD